ncbi:hypothetical protein ACRXCV_10455 [Halobacteriovorax sp. GFR7]|uniref:hypothetical protein n=1 Tax=unclassified Halobacteriovorax TaxID=2639665 RepID=UPI003D992EDC
MKKLLLGMTLLVSMSSFAGSFQTHDTGLLQETVVLHAQIDGNEIALIGKNRKGDKSVCIIKSDILEDVNLDPMTVATQLRHGKSTIKCTKEIGSNRFTVDSKSDLFIFI